MQNGGNSMKRKPERSLRYECFPASPVGGSGAVQRPTKVSSG